MPPPLTGITFSRNSMAIVDYINTCSVKGGGIVGIDLRDSNFSRDRHLCEFNAPRELVWEAITNSNPVVNWWGLERLDRYSPKMT